MGRLNESVLARTERFAHRVVDVAEALAKQRQSRRVVDQLIGCGTSVGANTAEASEALSRADFCRILGLVVRELAECRFWLRFISARAWIKADLLQPLLEEDEALRRILGSMIARVRRQDRQTDSTT